MMNQSNKSKNGSSLRNNNMSNKTNESTPSIVPSEEVVTRTESKSQLIRRLFFKDGMSVKDISSKTMIRYQMVRNVVKAEQDKIELAQLRNK